MDKKCEGTEYVCVFKYCLSVLFFFCVIICLVKSESNLSSNNSAASAADSDSDDDDTANIGLSPVVRCWNTYCIILESQSLM